jgi:hypothetical protein
MQIKRNVSVLLLVCLALAGCNLPAEATVAVPTLPATATPFQPIIGAQSPGGVTLEEGETEGAAAANWWFSPALPAAYAEAFSLPAGGQVVVDEADAHLIVAANNGEALSHWVYALVAPYPTLTENVSLEELQAVWAGDNEGAFAGAPLLMSAETQAVFVALWGEPAAGAVDVQSADALVDAAWAAQPAWAIIPFEEIEPRWKVLSVDGISPLWKEFDPANYVLSVPIGLSGDPTLSTEALLRYGPDSAAPMAPAGNRDANRFTTVAITGVTALVRATAYEMERSGVTYPAEDIGPMLREADITHISNEVPFARDCPAPDPVQRNLIFCSDPSYIELMEEVGTDVVELTGDHFNDWSREAMLYTLELYDERGWPYYGGGANIDEARAPYKVEHNGNKLAFIGCNGKGGGYASADVDYPGAGECDYAFMEDQVRELVSQGYLVIATFQHNEVYTFIPQPTLTRDFGRISAAGATIISGSQAHQAHGMEFPRQDAVIMYGLGNTFFDQRGVVDFGDQALIARHVFYDGKYLSTELFTIQFVDFAKPRYMTPEERVDFLTLIFNASIWDYPTE